MTLEYVPENIKNIMLYQLLIIDTLIQFDSCESWNLNHYYGEASNRDFCFTVISSLVFPLFRPVLYLPSKEFSVAVRFSPIKYELRPVLREGVKADDDEAKNLAPWEKYQVCRIVIQMNSPSSNEKRYYFFAVAIAPSDVVELTVKGNNTSVILRKKSFSVSFH